jgi:hypothetical protein
VGDFVREYGRIAGFFAAAAFILSLCIGLLSRNPFSTALLRAFLLAVVFAGLGAGLKAVIQRWLPELAERRAAGPASDAEAGVGQAVDIVLPGGGYAGAPAVDSGDQAGEPLEAGDEAAPLAEEAEDLAAEAEELPAEQETAVGPGAAGGSEQEAPLESLDAVSEEDEAAPGEAAPVRREPPSGPDSPGPDEELPTQALSRAGRDALPDLGELGAPSRSADPQGAPPAPKRAPGPVPGRLPARPSRRAATPDDAMRGALSSEDPESLAKAIRTVLKRDDKG